MGVPKMSLRLQHLLILAAIAFAAADFDSDTPVPEELVAETTTESTQAEAKAQLHNDLLAIFDHHPLEVKTVSTRMLLHIASKPPGIAEELDLWSDSVDDMIKPKFETDDAGAFAQAGAKAKAGWHRWRPHPPQVEPTCPRSTQVQPCSGNQANLELCQEGRCQCWQPPQEGCRSSLGSGEEGRCVGIRAAQEIGWQGLSQSHRQNWWETGQVLVQESDINLHPTVLKGWNLDRYYWWRQSSLSHGCRHCRRWVWGCL